jgi:hypothetical protein
MKIQEMGIPYWAFPALFAVVFICAQLCESVGRILHSHYVTLANAMGYKKCSPRYFISGTTSSLVPVLK